MIYKLSPRFILVRIKKKPALRQAFFCGSFGVIRLAKPSRPPIMAAPTSMNDYFVPKMRSPASPKPGTI